MFDKTDSASINIFSTTTATKMRVPTLMHDHVYRMSVAWQNVAYNQPPHLGYYLPDFVASRFDVVGAGEKEQTISIGEPIVDIVCKAVNCTRATLYYVYLNGERIKSYAAPEGMSFTWDSNNKTFTLAGTPAELGDYEYIVHSTGDVSGTAVNDTIRIHVVETTGISEIAADTRRHPSAECYYDLQGRRLTEAQLHSGQMVIVRRGNKTFKTVAK